MLVFRLRRDDILVVEASGSRDEVGKSALWREELPLVCLQNTLIRVRPRDGIDPEFLRWHLHLDASTGDLGGASKGIGIHHIGAARLASWMVNVPPRNEQRRIVAKLDAIFEQTRAAKARLERLPSLLDKLKRSILAAAFRGDLTADWRASHPNVEPASALLDLLRAGHRQHWEDAVRAKGKVPSATAYRAPTAIATEDLGALPPGWTWASVDDLAELQLGQQRAPIHANAEETHPYVRAANIKWDGLDLSDVKEMGFPDPERYRLRYGDVLLSEASGSASEVGKPAIWRDEIPGGCYQKTLLRARPRSAEVTSEWLHAAFLADALLGRFARMAPGVGILHLTADRMLGWPVPLAPVEEQHVLIERLRGALETIARLERTVTTAQENAERVEQATLARAFRGELTDQDPADEPAAALLERIRTAAEHAATTNGTKPTRAAKGTRAKARATTAESET